MNKANMSLYDITLEQVEDLELQLFDLDVTDTIALTRDQTLEVLQMLKLNLLMRIRNAKLK